MHAICNVCVAQILILKSVYKTHWLVYYCKDLWKLGFDEWLKAFGDGATSNCRLSIQPTKNPNEKKADSHCNSKQECNDEFQHYENILASLAMHLLAYFMYF